MPRQSPSKTRPSPSPRSAPGVTFETVRALALALPGVEEGTSYGTPALKVKKKLLARLREDGETLVLHVGAEEARDLLISSEPEVFFTTDHYAGYPLVLVRLARAPRDLLASVLEEGWRSIAPKLGQGWQPLAAPKRAAEESPPAKAKAKATPARGTTAKSSSAPPKAAAAGGATTTISAAQVKAAFERVRSICLGLPGATEIESHSRPAFAARGTNFVMFMDNHHGDGRLAIWCKAPPGAQGMLVESDPARFFVPPYLGPRGWVGVRLEGEVDWGMVGATLEEGYALSTSKRAPGKPAPASKPAPRKRAR